MLANISEIIDAQVSASKQLNSANQTLSQNTLAANNKIQTLIDENNKIQQHIGQIGGNVATRKRMLQLTEDSNVYKMKVIYSLLAIILCIIIIMLAVYSTTK